MWNTGGNVWSIDLITTHDTEENHGKFVGAWLSVGGCGFSV